MKYQSLEIGGLMYEIDDDLITLTRDGDSTCIFLIDIDEENEQYNKFLPEVQEEMKKLLEVYRYMKGEHPKSVTQLDVLTHVAGLLGVRYGTIQMKRRAGELKV